MHHSFDQTFNYTYFRESGKSQKHLTYISKKIFPFQLGEPQLSRVPEAVLQNSAAAWVANKLVGFAFHSDQSDHWRGKRKKTLMIKHLMIKHLIKHKMIKHLNNFKQGLDSSFCRWLQVTYKVFSHLKEKDSLQKKRDELQVTSQTNFTCANSWMSDHVHIISTNVQVIIYTTSSCHF